jgi:hypothetical protein
MTLIGRPSLPATTFPELLKWMSANKGHVNIANAGLGSASQLCGLLLQHSTGVQMTSVPYKGTAPAMTDLLGGQVDLMSDQTTNTTSQIESHAVKAYGVTTPKRLTTPVLAKLPTLQEEGLKGFNVTIWHALYAPKGTPKAVVDRLNAALKVALKDPEFVKREEALGAVVVNDARLNPAEHRKFVAAEIAKWAPIIKAAGPSNEQAAWRGPASRVGFAAAEQVAQVRAFRRLLRLRRRLRVFLRDPVLPVGGRVGRAAQPPEHFFRNRLVREHAAALPVQLELAGGGVVVRLADAPAGERLRRHGLFRRVARPPRCKVKSSMPLPPAVRTIPPPTQRCAPNGDTSGTAAGRRPASSAALKGSGEGAAAAEAGVAARPSFARCRKARNGSAGAAALADDAAIAGATSEEAGRAAADAAALAGATAGATERTTRTGSRGAGACSARHSNALAAISSKAPAPISGRIDMQALLALGANCRRAARRRHARRGIDTEVRRARIIPNSSANRARGIGRFQDAPPRHGADKGVPMLAPHRSSAPLATASSAGRAAGAAGAPELGDWQCAMEHLRELEYQFARARKAGNRDLMLRLRSEVQAATLRSDLLLARAVEASRRQARSLPPMFSVAGTAARVAADRRPAG